MLVIRKEQMEAFKRQTLDQFEQRMVVHLMKQFPEKARAMSASQLRELIQQGIQNAKTYRITRQENVACYLERMIMYSPDFDTSGKTAWAGTILRDGRIRGEMRMDRIADYEVFALRHQA